MRRVATQQMFSTEARRALVGYLRALEAVCGGSISPQIFAGNPNHKWDMPGS